MSLSRKRKRQLKKLRGQAEELLDHQREVVGHASRVAREAGRQAKHLNDELILPRVGDAIDGVRPQVDRGVAAARRAANQVRLFTAPLVASALARTVRGLERMENQEAASQVEAFGVRRGYLAPAKKKGRFGTIVAIGLGVAAAGAVGYALWQTFRSDDELWVAPEG